MNTFQLSCFLAVANHLNFTKAAEQMNISPPAITHQIKALESELNVKLFRRSTRFVEITPEGQSFLTDARHMLAIAEQAKLRFGDSEDRPIESISIGCSNYTRLDKLTEILRDLSAGHPNLHPRLSIVPHDQLFHLLETEAVDVIFDIREGCEGKDKVVFRELQRSSLVCVCSKAYLSGDREGISLRELEREKLIFCNPIDLVPDIAKMQWKLAEGRHPAEIHFCSSLEEAIVLAGAGFGIAILPDLLIPPGGDMVKLNLEEAPGLSYGLFYKSYPGDSILKEFVKSAKRHFADTAPPGTEPSVAEGT